MFFHQKLTMLRVRVVIVSSMLFLWMAGPSWRRARSSQRVVAVPHIHYRAYADVTFN